MTTSEEEKELEQVVLTRLLRLNATIQGIVLGLLSGSIIFIATIWLVIKGGDLIGPNLGLLAQFFPGYSVTVVGSFIGFFYGFIFGFILGYLVARLYNWILDKRDGK